MKFPHILLAVTGFFATCSNGQTTADIDTSAQDIQYSRIMRQKDGKISKFLRTPSTEILEKETFEPGMSTPCMKTIYRIDRRGNPLGCQIYDGMNRMLFKSRYGYDSKNGLLTEEQMFDARVKNLAKDGKTESPVRRFIYTYDANGKQNKPIAIVLKPGKKAEEVYAQPSALEENEFKKNRNK